MDLKPIIKTTIDNIKNINDSKEVVNAVNTVVVTLEKQNKAELIPDFVKQFNDALQNAHLELITVYTPMLLSEGQLKQLTEKVQNVFNISKEVKVEQIVDNSILGGIRIKYKDQEIDLTTNKKIKVIKKSI